MTVKTAALKEVVASRRQSNQRHRDFKVNCSRLEILDRVKKMVARDGIEPPTQGFSVPCSTN